MSKPVWQRMLYNSQAEYQLAVETYRTTMGPSVQCARVREDGTQCKAYAITGGRVCFHHGGAFPSAIKAARRKVDLVVSESKLGRLVRTLGTPEAIDPGEYLLQELYRTNGHVHWLAEQFAFEAPEDVSEAFVAFKRQAEVTGVGSKEVEEMRTLARQTHSGLWLDLYLKERAHGVKVAQAAISAGVEERYVRLAEKVYGQVAEAISLVIRELGQDPEDERVRVIAHRALSIAAGRDAA
jgi:hypothetical protein